MTEIKICGITNLDDAIFAAACGVQALGFIFYPQSPRYISPSDACAIITALPAEVARVGVFVNEKPSDVRQIYDFCGLDYIQLHGDETPAYCRLFSAAHLIKAVSPKEEVDLEALSDYQVHALLLDSRDAGLYGGTGRPANWELAVRVRKNHRLILAGGLKEDNIAAALAAVFPPAVDINSGVEASPGRKDPNKVRRIVDIIRSREAGQAEGKIFASRHALIRP